MRMVFRLWSFRLWHDSQNNKVQYDGRVAQRLEGNAKTSKEGKDMKTMKKCEGNTKAIM